MSDLIDRKKVIQKLREHRRIFCHDSYHIYEFSILSKDEKTRVDEIDNCIATIINLPSAEPERKKGKWVKDETTYPGPFTDNYVCSECGRIGGDWKKDIRQDQMYPFCPFCGADMRGGNEDNK